MYIYILEVVIKQYTIFLRGSVVRKLPSYRRMSRASLVVMSSSSQQHFEQEQFASVSSIEKSNSSGTREFRGENAIGPETLRLFG